MSQGMTWKFFHREWDCDENECANVYIFEFRLVKPSLTPSRRSRRSRAKSGGQARRKETEVTFDVNIYGVTAAKLITRRASEKSISMSRLVQLLLSLIKYILAAKFLSSLSSPATLARIFNQPKAEFFSPLRPRNDLRECRNSAGKRRGARRLNRNKYSAFFFVSAPTTVSRGL